MSTVGRKKFNQLSRNQANEMVAVFLPLDFGEPRILLTETEIRREISDNGIAEHPAEDSEETLALAALESARRDCKRPVSTAITRLSKKLRDKVLS